MRSGSSAGVCLFEFRAQGQYRWSKCLSAVTEQETRRQLRKLMGQPIVAHASVSIEGLRVRVRCHPCRS